MAFAFTFIMALDSGVGFPFVDDGFGNSYDGELNDFDDDVIL